MVAGEPLLAISIILALMSLVFGVAPKVTPGRADALVTPVVGGGACRWNDSPVPLFAVPMVRAPRLGTAATAVTGGAVATWWFSVLVAGAAAIPVEGTDGAVTVVCAVTWRFRALVAMVAGVSTAVMGVTVVAAVFSSVSASMASPILYGVSPLNAEHRMW